MNDSFDDDLDEDIEQGYSQTGFMPNGVPPQQQQQTGGTRTPAGRVMLPQLKFNPPKPFDGREENFEQFSYKLKAYLSMNNSKYRELMKRAEERDTPITITELGEGTKALSSYL